MRPMELYKRFVKVRKCIGCNRVLDYAHVDMPMCETCRLKWNRALLEECGKCFSPACECTCMPKILSSAGALSLGRLWFYDRTKNHTAEYGVLFLHKRAKVRRLLEFLSYHMCDKIRRELDTVEAGDDVIFTFVPRSKQSLRKYGFDQSEALAKVLSEKLGYECLRMFDTRLAAKKQRKLNSSARLANARENIIVKDTSAVKGKYAVLIDDVVTTGAGMSVCAKYLMKAGSKGVFCFCLTSKGR